MTDDATAKAPEDDAPDTAAGDPLRDARGRGGLRDAMAKPKKPPKSRRPQWILFAIVALLSLAADEGTKIRARGSLPTAFTQGHGVPGVDGCTILDDIVTGTCHGVKVSVIDGFWEWRLSMNPGSAFGLFSSQTGARVFLSIVGIAAVFGMLWMLRKARPDQKVLHWALALVAGGAVGNLVDRIYYGVVTDFVLWRYGEHEWPTFNVADVVLVDRRRPDVHRHPDRGQTREAEAREAAGQGKEGRASSPISTPDAPDALEPDVTAVATTE